MLAVATNAVRLTPSLEAFLARATVGIAGSRDADLVPHVHRASGWLTGDDGTSITCLFPEAFTLHLEDSLSDNGRLAFTVSEVPSHETYQFKGRHIDSRGVEDSDLAVHERRRSAFVERVMPLFGLPEPALRAFLPKPVLAVRFRLDEVFVQTPGPSAGRRILPEEET